MESRREYMQFRGNDGGTGLSNMDLSPRLARRKPPTRNFLPKINQSVAVKNKRSPRDDFTVRLDTSESDDELGEIKEARFASRRAIELLMENARK